MGLRERISDCQPPRLPHKPQADVVNCSDIAYRLIDFSIEQSTFKAHHGNGRFRCAVSEPSASTDPLIRPERSCLTLPYHDDYHQPWHGAGMMCTGSRNSTGWPLPCLPSRWLPGIVLGKCVFSAAQLLAQGPPATPHFACRGRIDFSKAQEACHRHESMPPGRREVRGLPVAGLVSSGLRGLDLVISESLI